MLCKNKRVGLVSVLPLRQPLPLKDYDPLNLTRECASNILDLPRFGVRSLAAPRQPVAQRFLPASTCLNYSGILGDGRHQNPGATDRALLSADQQHELREALSKPPPDGGMWNSRKVGEWIERRSGRVVSQKKQRGWDYLRRLKQSPKVPRPHHSSADKHEQESFLKDSP